MNTACALDITEFRVFELAFATWYGYTPSPKRIEADFVPYMFDGVVPHWVRQYTRKVLRLQREGRLDPAALGLAPRPRTRSMLVKAGAFLITLVFVFAGLLVMAAASGKLLPFVKECYFPPCY
ncbi:MAG: hypothetical protein GWN05_07750 [Gammaproteobacteria bacterium]|nr:hypothetical protein [Gammaproteobacteria bacterium]NIX11422.1 hypothetical protein [Gammaproteobacteria bacterium]